MPRNPLTDDDTPNMPRMVGAAVVAAAVVGCTLIWGTAAVIVAARLIF